MNNRDWKAVLGKVAPALATALGGPLAGVAVAMAGKAIGIGDGATEDQIAEAVLGGNPETLLKLKTANNDFLVQMKKLDVDVYAKDVEDRGSARTMAIAKGMGPQLIIAAIFTAGFVYVLGAIFGGAVVLPPEMREPAMYLLGILSACLMQIMNFLFGSSAGSMQKTTALTGFLKSETN